MKDSGTLATVGHRRRFLLGSGLALLTVGGFLGRHAGRRFFLGLWRWLRGNKSVPERLKEFDSAVHARLAQKFSAAQVTYPPSRVLLAAFKAERRLELYASDANDQLRFVDSYAVLAASGALGPKLRQGDLQVPEGIYAIDSLNPNSLFHLALHVSYPSEFDRKMARDDGRTNLGGDIMIHGGSSSVGCLAIGDQAIENLFVLLADVGLAHVSVVISPVDFRERPMPPDAQIPSWRELLYEPLRAAVQRLPPAKAASTDR